MGFKKTVLTLFLISASLFAQSQKQKIPFIKKNDSIELKINDFVPESFYPFLNSDFDKRMTLKEELCKQNKNCDFSNVIAETLYKKNPTSFTLENYKKCWEIVQAGRPFDTLNPQKYSVLKMTELCGFKRLHSFLKFYQKTFYCVFCACHKRVVCVRNVNEI